MDNPNPIKYSDLVKPDGSITDLIGQLNELGKAYDAQKAKIQGAAQELKQSAQGLSGATDEQRKSIELVTKETEKLEKEYRSLYSAEMELNKEKLRSKAANKEATQVQKLLEQLNVSAEGSYNRLSAQYRLNKMRLNEMTLAEREGTEAGRQLEQETAAIYEEMKRLQEVTGKHQLNVGNYADATKGLRMQIMDLTQQMVQLRLEGKQNTAEYAAIAQKAGMLRDAFSDAQKEVTNLASDTSTLNSVMQGLGAATGGFAVVTGAMNVFGGKSEDVQEAQRKLQGAIAATNGLTAIQNALQKQSALMLGVSKVQMYALAKAEAYERLIKIKGTEATVAATIAQRVFNAVANANPFVLLATALISVVGALLLFASGASKAAKHQTDLNNAMANGIDRLEEYYLYLNESSIKVQKNLSIEIEVMKARGASVDEIRKKEDELLAMQIVANAKRKGFFRDELKNLGLNKAALQSLKEELDVLEQSKASGAKYAFNMSINGKSVDKTDIDEAIDYIQSQINVLGKKIKIGTEIETDEQELRKQQQMLDAQRKKEDQQRAKTERDTIKETLLMRISLIRDSYERESKTISVNYDKQINDLQYRLRTESDLTKKTREALNAQIIMLAQKRDMELEKLELEHNAKVRAAIRENEDIQISLMTDGAEKRRKELQVSYARQIEDLETQLATSSDLSEKEIQAMYDKLLLLGKQYEKDSVKLEREIAISRAKAAQDAISLQLEAVEEGSDKEIELTIKKIEKEREIALLENQNLAEDVRQSEADINAKYDMAVLKATADFEKKRAETVLDAQHELENSELELMGASDRKKTKLAIKQEIERLELILKLNKTAAKKLTDIEIQSIGNTIEALKKKAAEMPYEDIWDLLGINMTDPQRQSVDTYLGSMQDSLNSLADSYEKVAEKAVQAAEKQVSAAQKVLDAEIEARANGYANNVEMAQKNLEVQKKNRDKALKEQRKAQKAQLAMDTLTQTSSLVTASANIWKSFSPLGPLGVAGAIAAIATMWASFAAAKVKAVQVSTKTDTEEYGEGTVELLQGGSHASGHDIDLGTRPDGTRRRAEGGEFFAVINKRNSKRFRNIIPNVINSFNDGSFAEKYQRANSGDILMAESPNLGGLERDVRAIREQGEMSRGAEGGTTVVQYKNLTRKILN